LLNYFIPTTKLISKTRVGSKIKKVYDKKALTPCQRLLASAELSGQTKRDLLGRRGAYNPVELQQQAHNAVAALMALKKTKELEGTASLATAALREI